MSEIYTNEVSSLSINISFIICGRTIALCERFFEYNLFYYMIFFIFEKTYY